jgi:dipeptidyl aminopeptidase/acylaminoacyl peptidase
LWSRRRFFGIVSLAILLAATVGPGGATQPAAGQAGSPPGTTAPPAASRAPADAPLPESFAELPFLSDAQLSPDGTKIAARVIVDNREHIGIWTLADPRDRPPRLLDFANVESFGWAGSNRLLIETLSFGILSSGNAIAYGPTRRIHAYDLAATKATQISQSRGLFSDTIFIDPDGRYVLIASQPSLESSPNVQRVDLDTGTSVEVQRRMAGVWSWFADQNGVIRVGVDYEDRGARIYYRTASDPTFRRAQTRQDLRDGGVVDAIRFVTNSDRGIIVTNAANGRFGVYNFDFATDTRGAPIFEHPEVDVTAAIFARDGSVDGVTYEDDRPRVRWFNPELAALQRRIDSTFRGKTNTIVNRSRDGNRVLIFSTAADDPGTYYVFDRAASRMEVFASPYDSLHSRRFAPVRAISYVGRAAIPIHAYLTLPAGRPERGLPLVLLPHGGPFLRDSWRFDPDVQMLASRGYAVLQPNFRGSTGYGRQFVERGYGQLGGAMIDDMEDGIDYLVREGIVDRSRVCIMGSSYGGYAAIWGAMRSPQRYRCAISFAGPTDLREMLRYNSNPFIPSRYVRQWRNHIRGEEGNDLDAISPARHPEMLRVPLLLAHGVNDVTVPPEQSQRLAQLLRRRNPTAILETAFYRKAAHGFSDQSEAANYYRRVAAFLAQHNPSDIPLPPAPTPPPAAPATPAPATPAPAAAPAPRSR